MKELFGQRLREQRLKHHLTLEQVAEKADLSANYIGMVEREPGLATIVKILNALNISADELLCDLVPSASHVTDDEISKRLEGLTPMQKKVALDLLDTYITNLPYLTKEE
jgi:transcriptional regulator with XRE-family HTH domain